MTDVDTASSAPDGVWQLLFDAHCHPTDDPRPWGSVEILASKLDKVKIGQICAMSTSTRDQGFVAELAERLGPQKLRPAFGYHPWFTHTISLTDGQDKAKHYEGLFFPQDEGQSSSGSSDLTKRDTARRELEQLLPHLPDPVPLDELLAELRKNLSQHPTALLGEVGLDRAFRLPTDPKGWTREPNEEEKDGGADMSDEERERTHALGRRSRPLTSLTPDIGHQAEILKAQIRIAIEMGRSVSLHSVRAGGATVEVLEALSKLFSSHGTGGSRGGLSRKQWKRQQKDAQRGAVEHGIEDGHDQGPSFDDINIDLHSCTLSPTMIRQLQQKHPNVYVSFSTAINSRQKNLEEQLRACDPKRLLTESDWHSAEGLAARTFDMVKLMTDVLGSALLGENIQDEDADHRYERAAVVLHENWKRFVNDEVGHE